MLKLPCAQYPLVDLAFLQLSNLVQLAHPRVPAPQLFLTSKALRAAVGADSTGQQLQQAGNSAKSFYNEEPGIAQTA
jgi:hypothetical protein